MVSKPPVKIIKVYPRRGPMQQNRLAASVSFHCFRCGQEKKSKLITIYNESWERRLCNGCYGRLLSIYDVKKGTGSDEEKGEMLSELLLKLVTADQVRQQRQLLIVADKRAEHLTDKSLAFVATSEYLATSLAETPGLDWSAAVIGLCKAVESELIARVIDPLKQAVTHLELVEDLKDKDLGRLAGYCSGRSEKPPELGTFTHALQTIIHSKKRSKTSKLIPTFLTLTTDWAFSGWLLDENGLVSSLNGLTTNFRNRAAHIDELEHSDYHSCREMAVGTGGILWEILRSTSDKKRLSGMR